jgi:predicted outer membrane protein
MKRIALWGVALAVGWLMNAGLGWSADAPATGTVLGKLHRSYLKEISLGRLAQTKAKSRAVKDLADTLVDDDTAADKKVLALAREQGIDLSTVTPPGNPADVASLQTAVDFDATFAKVLHDDQEEDLASASAAFDATKDEKLRALLIEIIPTERAHRDMARIVLDQSVERASL